MGTWLASSAALLLAGLAACGPQADVEEASLSSAALSPITIWIAGDSTVANGSSPCPIGWGGQFLPYFNSQVKVVNSAVGGRSVRTWLYQVTTTMDSTGECVLTLDSSGQPALQTRWQSMLDGMKSGDYLFIQFGINDGSATCDRHVGLNAFKASYGMMAQAAKQRGANPIFVTPLSAISCSGSTAQATRGSYVTATFEAGSQYGVPVIDLHALSIAYYNAQRFCPLPNGASDVSSTTGGAVGAFFCDDHTHLETSGAGVIAGLVAKAVRDQGIGLASYLADAPSSYSLTVNASGSGSTSPAAGTYSYASGTQVTVTATPASGYAFTGWSGAASGTGNPATITMDGNKTLTANFGLASGKVRIFIAGDSTVMTYTANSIHQAGWGQYLASYFKSTVTVDNQAIGGRTSRRFIEEGRLATILSSMQAGDYLFVQFGTNDSNKTATYSDGEPYYLAPGTDFKTYIQQYIDGAKSKGGTPVLVSPPNRNTCTNGTFAYSMSAYETAMKELGQANGVPVVTLGTKTVAYLDAKNSCDWASANFYLNRADGTIDGTHFQENGANILAGLIAGAVAELKLPLASHLLNAPTYYTLTLAASGNGSTSPAAGTTSYTSGTQVTVTATPASGYVFTGWSGAASGTGNPVTITVDGNKTLTASFALVDYTLTVNNAGGGSTSPAAGTYSFASGTQVMVTATPASGYVFAGWSGAASGTSNPVTITMDGNKALTANFAAAQDITPPSVPSNLSWNNSDGTVELSWQPSTDNVGVTGYGLYYGSFFLGTFEGTSLALIGFKAGTPYVFTVKAQDAAGNVSAASNQATVLVPLGKDTTPPTTPSNLRATNVTSTSVSLSWTASTDDVGVVVYQVYQGATVARTVTSASATITGLTPSVSYTFGVQAFDAAGNASGLGGPLTVTTGPAN
jgi:uncharacterized repeat protein (TIGR02543 family)